VTELPRTAALPMYDADRAAVQAWWQGLAAALRAEGIDGAVPELDWPRDLDAHWRNPNLLLSQACGYPLVARLAGVVQVIGAFRYNAEGCAGIDYRSEIVVRDDDPGEHLEDFRGRTAVCNDRNSYSGFHALRARVEPLAQDGPFFARWVESGAHRASIELVRDGAADIAAIDCITLAGLRRQAPQLLSGMRLVGSTALAPGLPLITAAATTPDELQRIRRALRAACATPSLAQVRERLFIDGFDAVDASAWRSIADLRRCPDAPRQP
jgi:ABC-type phosphate/phosphonate transport system substrate-binding protein